MPSPLTRFSIGDVDVFMSPEAVADFLDRDKDAYVHFCEVRRVFLGADPARRRLVEAYADWTGNPRIGILSAHGVPDPSRWYYEAAGREFLVQGWLDRMDGKYSALLLSVCNPENHSITSRKSLVLAPDNTLSGARLDYGKVNVEAYLPGRGYLDELSLEDEIFRLEGVQGGLDSSHAVAVSALG